MSDLVTAIIPTYNRAALLARALTSVAAQEYRPIEVLVIDDGSTDATPQMIPEQERLLAAQGIPLTYHRQANAGPGQARNAGISLSRGSLLSFLDSDDFWKPEFVSTLHRLLSSHPSAGLAFGGYLAVDRNERLIKQRDTGLPPQPEEGLMPRPFEAILRHMPMGTPCVMVRRSVIDDVGSFDVSFRLGEDWDLWYRIARKYDFVYSQRGLTCCREHPNNTPKFTAAALADQVRLIHKHLPDVAGRETRSVLVRRLRRCTTLFQEQLLREGLAANGNQDLLQHPLAPRTLRFFLGRMVGRQPIWVGRAYARLVRALGTIRR
jgi:glycosyltransferase involved in cell wall biosynthesis